MNYDLHASKRHVPVARLKNTDGRLYSVWRLASFAQFSCYVEEYVILVIYYIINFFGKCRILDAKLLFLFFF